MGALKKVYAAAIFFLIVGGMAWGYMGMMGKNIVSEAFGKKAWIIYGIVGISAILVLLVGRNAFLPFLGPTVFPCAALSDKVPENADTNIQIQVRPGAKVLYWGAEPANDGLMTLKSWKDAYGGYENVGVATADASGMVTLSLRKPQPYTVPLKGRLESHVHYRMCLKDGWLSQVETHTLLSEPIIPTEIRHIELFQTQPKEEPQPQPQPQPQPPVLPVTQTPETPVVADPISGLPTAIPGSAAPIKKENGAETPSPIEGFTSEPVFSATEGPSAMWGTMETEDPRLLRLRTTVETEALGLMDEMARDEPHGFMGTELDAAFQPTLKPAGAPTRAWDPRNQ